MASSLELIDCRQLPLDKALSGAAHAEAVVPAELVRIDEDTFASWGKGLSLAQYLRRERVMRATAFSQRGLRTWVLRGKAGAVLSSCETYDVPVSGKKSGLGHGIASVYVEPQHRGHGYASELLQKVHATLKSEGALACYLMSEIGPTLYSRLGYVGRPLFVRRYAAAPASESHGATPPWELFSMDDVAKALRARQLPSQPLYLDATAEQALWHMERARFYAGILNRPWVPAVGARAGDALALWAADYRPEEESLRVLLLYPGARLSAPGAVFEPRSPEGEALRNVLHAARTVAGKLGLPAIEVWENPHNAGYLRGGVRVEDHGDLPMLLGLGSGVRGEDWLDYERIHWL